MKRAPIFLAPGEGRDDPMGRIRALFKADRDETAGRYSISEWWLEPRTNRSDARAGVLNLSCPGGFEEDMPGIVEWFEQHPPGRAG